jgi:predicted ester cyclase
MSPETNRALVKQFFDECWNQGKVDVLHEIMSPDHVHHLPGWELHGPDEIKDLILDLRASFPDLHIGVDDEIIADDKVVIRWTMRGTHLGNLGNIAPTGKRVEYIGIDILRCAGSKIVELWGVPDTQGLFQQLRAS